MSVEQIEKLIAGEYLGNTSAFRTDALAAVQNVNALARSQKTSQRVPEGPTIVELTHVTKNFKLSRTRTVEALKGVSLTICKGEVVAIVGPSGSGKSTLMNMIGGLDKPSTGCVAIGGRDLGKMSDKTLSRYRGKQIGFIFQFFYLQPFLSLARNVEVPLMFAGVKRKERAARVRDVLERVGLIDQSKQRPSELSGGQIQRAAIARALVNRPDIILADEPTGNLDSTNSKQIVDLLLHLRSTLGTTVVIITHDMNIANAADRKIVIKDGVIA